MKVNLISLIGVLMLIQFAEAAVYKFSPEKGRIYFYAKGRPAFIAISGEGEGVSGQLTSKDGKFSGDINFNLKSLKTGIELRDEHLQKKYLEVDKFSNASLRLNDIEIPANSNEGFPFKGILNLHGNELVASGLAKTQSGNGSNIITAEFTVNLSHFKIEIPNFQGITVVEEVQVKLEAPFLREE